MDTTTEWTAIFNAVSDAVALLDNSHRILRCNSAMARLTGIDESDIIGKHCWEIVHGTNEPISVCPVLIMEKTLKRESLTLRMRDGWFQVTVDPILDANGKLYQTVHIVRDISDAKRAEEEMVQTAERFRAMIDTAPYGAHLYELHPDGRLIFSGANRSADTILGVSNHQFIGKTIEVAFPNLVATEVPTAYRRVAATGVSYNTEQVVYRDDQGISGAFEVCAFQTAPNRMAALFRDITEKKRAEEALRRSREELARERERLVVTLRSIGDGVITTDTEGRIVFLNPIAENLTGWSAAEATGKPLTEVFRIINELTRQPCENPVEKVLKTGLIVELANHTVLISRDGRELSLADSGSPIKDDNGTVFGVVLVFRDITEKQKLLDTLQQTQKLDSLGVLAGGIAHDFNNLLGGLFGFIDLALLDTALSPTTTGYLDNAMQGLSRARSLTQQLLTFSKGGEPVRKPGSVEKTVREAAAFALSGSNIACIFSTENNLRTCDFDENQIGQVVDNLVLNAQQAMPAGGSIEVSVKNRALAAGENKLLGQGNYIEITVRDYGIGIPRQIIDRIFDPFFTTKQKGHGLGLATSYSIIRKHDGAIDVVSEPGKGSVFTVLLPASSAQILRETESTALSLEGSGRILVMDDEGIIRDTVCTMLKKIGYDPVCVSSGEEVLKRLELDRSTGRSFTAVILDLTVPGGMGGKAVVERIRKTDTAIPVIVASGYSDDPAIADPVKFGFSGAIAKPFTIRELREVLRTVTMR